MTTIRPKQWRFRFLHHTSLLLFTSYEQKRWEICDQDASSWVHLFFFDTNKSSVLSFSFVLLFGILGFTGSEEGIEREASEEKGESDVLCHMTICVWNIISSVWNTYKLFLHNVISSSSPPSSWYGMPVRCHIGSTGVVGVHGFEQKGFHDTHDRDEGMLNKRSLRRGCSHWPTTRSKKKSRRLRWIQLKRSKGKFLVTTWNPM